jgi:hypothetical protein
MTKSNTIPRYCRPRMSFPVDLALTVNNDERQVENGN